MDESELTRLHAEAVLRAHLRQVVITEILRTLRPHEAALAISAAVQRLAQYADEGPVQSIARVASEGQFRAAIDQVIEELQFMLPTLK